MKISLGNDLNSSIVGEDLLENKIEFSLEKDFDFLPVGENLL